MEFVKRPDITHETNALGLEHLPDGLSRLFEMAMSLGIGNAFVEQPSNASVGLAVTVSSTERPADFSLATLSLMVASIS